ncbi:hypothetical protein [Pyxidicoccus caerfyrddinensis]|uniref:hypothetical protein n=1 Tax=Pyxidicoccus caerfyrddinensis TaxID=2709663 RepID=UPI0013DA35AE|nr:hypothetical protein [Pyxidicoccus caerfyrddinensis]
MPTLVVRSGVLLPLLMAMTLTLLPIVAEAEADDIEAFGRACALSLLPNELRATSNENADTAFRKIACENYFHDETSAVEGNGDLSVWVIDVAANGKSTARQVTNKAYCSDVGLYVSSRSSLSIFQRYTTPEALQAWQACMNLYSTTHNSAAPAPVKANVKASTLETVTVTFRWDRNVNPDAGAPNFQSIDATGLACPKAPIPQNSAISFEGEGNAVVCSWNAESRVGTVAINHSRGTSVVSATRPNPKPEGTVVLNVVATTTGVTNQYRACGPIVDSLNLHNERCIKQVSTGGKFTFPVNRAKEPGYDCVDNRWLRYRVCAELRTTNASETITNPQYTCARDNDGSCGWNAVGDPGRLTWEVSQPQHVRACQQLGSRSVSVALCGTINVTGTVPKPPQQARIWPVSLGNTFEFNIPRDVSGDLIVATDGKSETIKVGENRKPLLLLRSDPDHPLGPYYQYQYIGWGANAAAWPRGMFMPVELRKAVTDKTKGSNKAGAQGMSTK